MITIEQRIQEGLDGKYQGLANGFDRINNYLFGIQRSTYYLLGGMSGTFKTTLADFMLLNALIDAKKQGVKCTVFYYSYEISEVNKKCDWISMLIYKKHGKFVPKEVIKGLGSFRLTVEQQALVNDVLPEVNQLFNEIHFRFSPTNPTGIYNELWAYAQNNGTLHKAPIPEKPNETLVTGYTPNDEKEYRIVVLDHLALLRKERGFSTKEVIDKYSEYCVTLRNICGYSFINISQFNDGLSSVDRAKFKGVDLSPQMTDFKDTRNPYADADVVIGTMSPYKLDMDNYLGYDIRKLRHYFLAMKVIKNRLSSDNIAIGLLVDPKGGVFKEMPKLNDTQAVLEIYKRIESLNE